MGINIIVHKFVGITLNIPLRYFSTMKILGEKHFSTFDRHLQIKPENKDEEQHFLSTVFENAHSVPLLHRVLTVLTSVNLMSIN